MLFRKCFFMVIGMIMLNGCATLNPAIDKSDKQFTELNDSVGRMLK